MSQTPKSVLVDKDLRPAYYDDFHCLAAGCRLSCCKGWRISFDKKDYLSLKRKTARLSSIKCWKAAYAAFAGGRCPRSTTANL